MIIEYKKRMGFSLHHKNQVYITARIIKITATFFNCSKKLFSLFAIEKRV